MASMLVHAFYCSAGYRGLPLRVDRQRDQYFDPASTAGAHVSSARTKPGGLPNILRANNAPEFRWSGVRLRVNTETNSGNSVYDSGAS